MTETNADFGCVLLHFEYIAKLISVSGDYSRILVGCTSVHKKFGRCKIKRIVDGKIYTSFSEAHGDKTFVIDSIGKGFFIYFNIPYETCVEYYKILKTVIADIHNLNLQILRAKEEVESEENEKHEIVSRVVSMLNSIGLSDMPIANRDTLNLATLEDVLKDLLECRDLSDIQIKWLSLNGLQVLVGEQYRRQYEAEGSLGVLARACSAWRKAGKPKRCIEYCLPVLNAKRQTTHGYCALLTSLGGAYRDCGDINSAFSAAKKTVDIDQKSYFPWNLMGALHYQIGECDLGDSCFSKAEQLGSNSQLTAAALNQALGLADKSVQKEAALRLLSKDPVNFSWANKYL